jgi:hypothetical protein
MSAAVGDWIRFMHDGKLVIDEIAYLVPRAAWDSTIEAVTLAHGQVSLDSVRELRRARQEAAALRQAWAERDDALAERDALRRISEPVWPYL